MVNKDDLRRLRALCVEIRDEITEEHRGHAQHQNLTAMRSVSMQLLLDLEHGYFEMTGRWIDEVLESSDLDADSENREAARNCTTMAGILSIKIERSTDSVRELSEQIDKHADKKKKLIEEYKKLKKKIGI
jgi:hypothetical protein